MLKIYAKTVLSILLELFMAGNGPKKVHCDGGFG